MIDVRDEHRRDKQLFGWSFGVISADGDEVEFEHSPSTEDGSTFVVVVVARSVSIVAATNEDALVVGDDSFGSGGDEHSWIGTFWEFSLIVVVSLLVSLNVWSFKSGGDLSSSSSASFGTSMSDIWISAFYFILLY